MKVLQLSTDLCHTCQKNTEKKYQGVPVLQKETKFQPLKLMKTILEKPNVSKKSTILLLMLAEIFLRAIRQFHFSLAVAPALWMELSMIPMSMPSKCTTQAILNIQVTITSKCRKNAVFLAYVVNLYHAKLIISLTNQSQCMIFSKTIKLVKQTFTSMQTTVVAKTKTICPLVLVLACHPRSTWEPNVFLSSGRSHEI